MTHKKSHGLGPECMCQFVRLSHLDGIDFAMCKWAVHQGLVKQALKNWAEVQPVGKVTTGGDYKLHPGKETEQCSHT